MVLAKYMLNKMIRVKPCAFVMVCFSFNQFGVMIQHKLLFTVARDGGKIIWQGLYFGIGGNLAGVLPASALFFRVYEPTKQKLLKVLPEKFSAVAHLAAGALRGAVLSIFRVPTEVVKQWMQTGEFSSASDAVRLIIAKEGFGGMYAGFGSFLLRDLPSDALQFCVYEQIRIGYNADLWPYI